MFICVAPSLMFGAAGKAERADIIFAECIGSSERTSSILGSFDRCVLKRTSLGEGAMTIWHPVSLQESGDISSGDNGFEIGSWQGSLTSRVPGNALGLVVRGPQAKAFSQKAVKIWVSKLQEEGPLGSHEVISLLNGATAEIELAYEKICGPSVDRAVAGLLAMLVYRGGMFIGEGAIRMRKDSCAKLREFAFRSQAVSRSTSIAHATIGLAIDWEPRR